MKRLLQEPLVHFLVLGALLFAAYQYWEPTPATASSKEIRLSLDQLRQLALQFQSQWRRPPTAAELEKLVEAAVQSEILYREALAMGLDKDDEIVKRRMVQKMQFIAEDVAAAHEPTPDELRVWFDKNRARFALPGRLSFRHLYFSPDRRGARTRADAQEALSRLAAERQGSKAAANLADPFMFQDSYADRAVDVLRKEFGPQFVLALEKLPVGQWSGPVESGFGWHVVFVDAASPARAPSFEEVEPDVRAAWLGEQRVLAWHEAYNTMRAKYTVLVPEVEGAAVAPPTAPPPAASSAQR